MKLELNGNEVKAILLEHMQAKFPGQFNTVESAQTYEGVRGVVFTLAKTQEDKE